jgi:hypothetical protein
MKQGHELRVVMPAVLVGSVNPVDNRRDQAHTQPVQFVDMALAAFAAPRASTTGE